MHNCCNDYTRSQLLRSAAAEAGSGLPVIEPGMPEPAGTGLSRRTFLSRAAGMALAVYGASKIPLSAFEDRASPRRRRPTRSSSRSSSTAASTRSACWPRSATPATRSCARTWRWRRAPAPTFSEDPRLQWHPAAAGLATLHGEGKVSAFPAIGYDHPDQSHFTSRHFYEIGELAVGFRTGWLGRYIDAVGDDENPLQGLSMDGSLSPMIATAERPVAAIDSVDGYDLWSPVSDPIESEMFRSFARFGSLPSDSPGLAQVRRATSQTDKLRQDLGGVGEFTSPVAYPDTYFAHKLAGLAAFIAFGLPMRVVTIRAAGGYDTHADQADRPRTQPARNLRGPARLPARPRGARPRRPGDGRDVERVRAPARRRTARPGTDHGAAGCAFVIGSKAKGEMVGEFPGLAKLDANENLRVTSDFRGMYCSLLEQWLGQDAGRDHPRRLRLRPADAGEGMRRARRRRLALGAGRPAGLAPGPAPPGGSDRAAAAECAWQRHRKRVVKHVRAPRQAAPRRPHAALVDLRAGCRRRPGAGAQPAPAPPARRPRPNAEPAAEPDRRQGRRRSARATASRSPARSVGAGEVTVELNNQGEDPHNLNLQREGGGEPAARSPKPARAAAGPRASTCRRAPTGSGAACPSTRKRACTPPSTVG